MTHRTMSEQSYHEATIRSPQLLDVKPLVIYLTSGFRGKSLYFSLLASDLLYAFYQTGWHIPWPLVF